MNNPPESFVRVPHEKMQAFVATACTTVGLPADKAELLAGILTGNDLKGVFSHGTQQIATYAILMRDGTLNNSPDVKVVQETPVSLLVDGDGGLGYFPSHEGTTRAIEKAKAQGVAVMLTRNHGHFGAAGIYARLTLEHDLITFVTSGHQLNLKPDGEIWGAAGGSPMAFSAPTLEEDPLVLDFGTMHDFYGGSPHREEIARMAPGVVLRSIGMGMICQSWGGLLAGYPMDPARHEKAWPGANQGALVMTFRIDLFSEPERFKREMDAYARAVSKLKPLEGFERSYLPGGPEAERERAYREEGIPVGERHRGRLEKLAGEIGIGVPW
jgi:LDH2 family malate/lactate/ureidoglycolate dehydrogenase